MARGKGLKAGTKRGADTRRPETLAALGSMLVVGEFLESMGELGAKVAERHSDVIAFLLELEDFTISEASDAAQCVRTGKTDGVVLAIEKHHRFTWGAVIRGDRAIRAPREKLEREWLARIA